jgi:catechol 2,3-dioxygenase-like lactoylglutathione lyase family enzyme
VPDLPHLHHLTLTVTDPQRSAQFYQRLFGPGEVVHRTGPGWTRVRVQWPGGLMMGFTRHDDQDAAEFDHRRIGLDHAGFGCRDEDQVRAWASRLDELGVPRGPVEDAPYAVVVTGRDPDAIPVEFYWPRSGTSPA